MQYHYSDKISDMKPSAIREILKYSSTPGMIPLSAGNPAPEAFPKEALAEIAARLFRDKPIEVLQYGITEGYTPLRDHLRTYLRGKYGVGTDDDDVIITNGGQQVMELSVKCLCNEGDTVVVEDPSFIGSLNSFRSLGGRLVGVPVQGDGIDTGALERALASNEGVRFLYTIPNYQNPTGVTMSLEKRKKVYELAQKYNILIVEDNPYGDLYYDGVTVPSIKSLDTDGRVIYAGSFSKVISPGLRVGFCVCNAELQKKLVVAKQVEDVQTANLTQMLCYEFMTSYDYEKHLDGLRALYSKKAALTTELVEKNLVPHGVTYFGVRGGIFMWCTLPDGVDMNEFCLRGVKQYSVAVVPGAAFLPDPAEKTQSFRINFSTPTNEDLIKGIETLGKMLS